MHWADHCATCHGNDGRGQTEIGRNLYPKAPDMRLSPTQKLSKADGDTRVRDLRSRGLTAADVIGRAAVAAGLVDVERPLRAADVPTMLAASRVAHAIRRLA